MATKVYRLKVNKIPLSDDIPYRKPNFPPFGDLHLDLLENKLKLKKNAPKPIFVLSAAQTESKRETFSNKKSSRHSSEPADDFTLEELENAYHDHSSESEIFKSDSRSSRSRDRGKQRSPERSKEPPPPQRQEYRQEDLQKEMHAELDGEEKERQEHADLLFKFLVLRKKYPNVEIPEFTDHSDIQTMKRVYDQIIRRVSLDSNVESYKTYLTGGMMVLEWVSTNWMGIDLSGFTNHQMGMMNKYDQLLIELGEKNYSTLGSRFPVELRLIFFILFNAGLFYVQKMIFSGGGGGGPSILSTLFGSSNTPNAPSRPAKRAGAGMRGPTITPHEVEELTRQKEKASGSDDDS